MRTVWRPISSPLTVLRCISTVVVSVGQFAAVAVLLPLAMLLAGRPHWPSEANFALRARFSHAPIPRQTNGLFSDRKY